MIDTSVVLAILLAEEDWERLSGAVLVADEPFVTPVVELEASTVLATRLQVRVPEALALVRGLLHRLGVVTRPLALDVSQWAAEAYERFGKGRHPARLNFGDCLSYGAARSAGVGLLYKGDDFSRTDLPPLPWVASGG